MKQISLNTLLHRSFRLGIYACLSVSCIQSLQAHMGTVKSGNWNDPTVWHDNRVPAAGDDLHIEAGHTIILNANSPSLGGVMIHGLLKFQTTADRSLTAKWIMIHGEGAELQVGTQSTPYTKKAIITLTGTNETENIEGVPPLNSGTKFIMPMNGGRLNLHGASRSKLPWTKLNGSTGPGATSLTLAVTPTGWAVGDKICIAPSSFNPTDAEVVTISSISGTTVNFSPALQKRHYGATETISGKLVDERAEVGMLTRNIVIQGAADSDASKFGAHTMVMPGGRAFIEGVEFTKTGQAGHKGRYSMHWHWVDRQPSNGVTGAGQYIKNCSFHNTFQRAVNIHGTHGVLVQNNVAYNIQNHAYVWSEDGDEENNIIDGNLAVLVKFPPVLAEIAFPEANPIGEIRTSVQNEDEASGFWGRNPNNIIKNNAVGGVTRGNGFYWDIEHLNETSFPQARVVDGTTVVENNVAHSIRTQWASGRIFNPHMYDHVAGFGFTTSDAGLTGDNSYNGPGLLKMKNNVVYKCVAGGFWLDGREHVTDAIIANVAGGFHAKGCIIQRTLIAGYTGNSFSSTEDTITLNSQSIHTRKPTGVEFPKLVDQSIKTFRGSEITFSNVSHAAWSIADVTGFGKAMSAENNTYLGTTHNWWTFGNFGEMFIDWNGQISGTGVHTLISDYAINSTSVSRPDFGNDVDFPVHTTALSTSGQFRGRITSPSPDQVLTSSSVTFTYQLFNLTGTPNMALRVGDVNPVDYPISTTSSSLTINNLPEGTHKVFLVNKSVVASQQNMDRIFITVNLP